LFKGGMTEAVIGPALLRIRKGLIGFIELFEANFRFFIAGIAVGMPFMASLRKADFNSASSAVRATPKIS
jgi:hypothetical protein